MYSFGSFPRLRRLKVLICASHHSLETAAGCIRTSLNPPTSSSLTYMLNRSLCIWVWYLQQLIKSCPCAVRHIISRLWILMGVNIRDINFWCSVERMFLLSKKAVYYPSFSSLYPSYPSARWGLESGIDLCQREDEHIRCTFSHGPCNYVYQCFKNILLLTTPPTVLSSFFLILM